MEVMGEGIMLIHLRCRCNLDLWNVRYSYPMYWMFNV
jgi:hypothetical protein